MAKQRTVRMDQFTQKIAEEVLPKDNIVRLELSKDDFVTIKLPIFLEEDDPYQEQMKNAQGGTSEDIALVILGYDPDGRSAEEQLALWKAHDYSLGDLARVFAKEVEAAQDRLGKFRFKS